MPEQSWLPLNEYSLKYKISMSTLRRRIRSNEIKFRFEDGKYWLADQTIAKHLRVRVDAPTSEILPADQNISAPITTSHDQVELLEGANKLLQAIKEAYVKILHDKEEQVLELKEEVADLRTLVKVLEQENDRLKLNLKESAPIDGWLSRNFEK